MARWLPFHSLYWRIQLDICPGSSKAEDTGASLGESWQMFEITEILSRNTQSFRIYLDRATRDHFHGHHAVQAPNYRNSCLGALATPGSPPPPPPPEAGTVLLKF